MHDDYAKFNGSSSTTLGTGVGWAYDPLGNPLSTTDPRGNTTTFDRNEIGEVYRTTSPAPYSYQVETSYDANRNVIQVDTQDVIVQYTSDDPNDPAYAQFLPSGSGTTANLPVKPGPGGSVRPGWFSNLYTYDLLDNKVEEDIDATGSTPSSLVTTFNYDFNQNLIEITKPLGNTIEHDYDERNLRIATRVGGPDGSTTVMAYDGNGNMTDMIGPATRGTPAQTLSCVIADAFSGGPNVTFSGDWLTQNTYDGFDRLLNSTDAVGGMVLNTFDPGGRNIATQALGSPGGETPIDRTGSTNIPLASGETRYDEAGRVYEQQQDVFLGGGYYGGFTFDTLPSGRAVTHTGGGLAANSAANDHTGTVTLTAGGRSYVLSRTVYDRADRVAATVADNGAVTAFTLDGAGRRITATDALGNVVQNTFDANGNVTNTTRIEKCTISSSIAPESFSSAMAYDVLNRLIVLAEQGPDGNLNPVLNTCCAPPATPNQTIFTLYGFDSRGNRTNLVDPKQNTTVWEYDGANRRLREKRMLRSSGDGTTAVYDTVLTQTAFDANSNTIRLVDDNGGTTAWAYDLQDRQTTMTFHDGSTRQYTYDLASDVVSYTDENGSVFTNYVDVLGRKVLVHISRAANVVGTTIQSFQFDGLSRMTFCTDHAPDTNALVGFSYDSISRVLEEQQTYANDTRYVTHNAFTSYPSTGFTFPNARQIAVGFDALYRKNAINEGTSGGANIAAWQFFGGRTATVTFGNGLVTSYMNNAGTHSAVQPGVPNPAWGSISTDHLGYDGSGRLIGKRHFNGSSVLVGFTAEYDPSSNKLYERALHAESRSSLYAMDSMDRLIQYQRGVLASGGGSVTTPIALPGTDAQRVYALDGLGNWKNTGFTPEGGSAETELRTHNKLNQIVAFGVAPASTPVTYDNGNNVAPNATRGNGNIANDGTRVYAWDALNRLITVNAVGGGNLGTYAYDALGRRIIRTINGSISGGVPTGTSRYLLDGQQIVEELSSPTGTTTIQYVSGQYVDELVQLNAVASIGPQSPQLSGQYYLLSDLLYRSAALTSTTPAIVEAYDTDAYGNTLLFIAGGGTGGAWWSNSDTRSPWSACRFVFTGREYDAETANYFYRARYYSPAFGRFAGRNPIRASMNLVEYVGSLPAIRTDPSGEKVFNIKSDVRWFFLSGNNTPRGLWDAFSAQRHSSAAGHSVSTIVLDSKGGCAVAWRGNADLSDPNGEVDVRGYWQSVKVSFATSALSFESTGECVCAGKKASGLIVYLWHIFRYGEHTQVAFGGNMDVNAIAKVGAGDLVGGKLGGSGTVTVLPVDHQSYVLYKFTVCPGPCDSDPPTITNASSEFHKAGADYWVGAEWPGLSVE